MVPTFRCKSRRFEVVLGLYCNALSKLALDSSDPNWSGLRGKCGARHTDDEWQKRIHWRKRMRWRKRIRWRKPSIG